MKLRRYGDMSASIFPVPRVRILTVLPSGRLWSFSVCALQMNSTAFFSTFSIFSRWSFSSSSP